MEQEFYSVKETAIILGWPEQTVYTKVRRKQIAAFKMKNRVLIHRTTLNQMIADKQVLDAEV
jgi:excisionase family DNA binding protein